MASKISILLDIGRTDSHLENKILLTYSETTMKLKYLIYPFFFLLVVVIFFIYNNRDLGLSKKNSTYVFSKLDPKVAAQVTFRKDLMVDGKPFSVLFEDILDEHYTSLVNKKEELLILAAIEQHVNPTEKKIIFGTQKPKRLLKEICNQYQVHCPNDDQVVFDPQQSAFLKTDTGMFDLNQIDQSSLQLRAAHSEVLNYLLQKISQNISNRLIYLISKQQNLTAQEFIDQYIFPNAAKGERPQNQIDKYIQQHLVQKPIVINIQQPQYDFESRWEWTPFFGIAPRSNSVHVVFFADFLSDASRKMLQLMLQYKNKKLDATFGFHPFFPSQDAMQRMLAEVSFCAWLQDKEIFWKLLNSFLLLKKDFTEQELYELVQKENLNVKDLKSCFLQHKTKDVVDYHLKTAQFLKIINPPVVFIGNEVHIGPISEMDFERILERQ
ncbi:hypothetical protein K2X05_05615 [bacterium]|nr:hypothetical protein [bacterium]